MPLVKGACSLGILWGLGRIWGAKHKPKASRNGGKDLSYTQVVPVSSAPPAPSAPAARAPPGAYGAQRRVAPAAPHAPVARTRHWRLRGSFPTEIHDYFHFRENRLFCQTSQGISIENPNFRGQYLETQAELEPTSTAIR